MTLEQDIKLSSEAFKTAANEMSALKTRAETLKTTLEQMYNDLTTALDTPAGKEIEIEEKDVQNKPKTLDDIKDTAYYLGVFDKYEQLMQNIKFN